MILKILVLAAIPLILALSALPKVLIERAAGRSAVQAVAAFRDTLPDPAALDPEQAEQEALDAKWASFWRERDREALILATALVDSAAEDEARADRFAAACDDVVKRFAAAAVELQQAHACRLGGWESEIERQAVLIVERSGHCLARQAHALAVEAAECTETLWTEDDAQALNEYLDSEEAAALR